MKKYLLPGFVFFLIIYFISIIYNYYDLSNKVDNPDYQEYIATYKQNIENEINKVLEIDDNSKFSLNYMQASTKGTTGNFEGPQVHLQGIKFHNEFIDHEDERLLHLDAVSAHFDPDHTYFGLPDVKISIQDVRLYQPEKSKIAEFLDFGNKNDPKPYKIYKKKIIKDTPEKKSKYLVMQLWLTEFQVNIDIRPDRDIPIKISDNEKNSKSYPGFWYGSTERNIKLKDLNKEYQDSRYNNLTFVLKIIPDNSPIYLKTNDGQTAKPDFAIAAIYCNGAKIGNEPEIQRISTNIHAGQPLFLNNKMEFDILNEESNGFSKNLEYNANKIINTKAEDLNFIWNKPYYFKLFFNNLGTWRSGVFNQNQYHDQVNYKFLMPLFVIGSWDIIAPQEVLSKWNPPEQYIRKITFKNFLPFLNMSLMGKVISTIIIIAVMIVGIIILFPGIIPALSALLKLR